MVDLTRVFAEEAGGVVEDFRAAKRELAERFLRPSEPVTAQGLRALTVVSRPEPTQNVVGVGIGEKIAGDRPTGQRAIKFFVRVKYPAEQLPARERLPRMVGGLPTDVEQTGTFRRLRTTTRRPATTLPNPQTRIRPAQPGSSVGFRDPANQFVMAGTFGALVKDRRGQYILSNNHVLADENRLPAGAPIFQPGLLDGGNVRRDKIAELTRFASLQAGTFNPVDCAIARVLDRAPVSNAVLYIGPPRGAAAAQLDMIVHKFGRTTSYTVGRIVSLDTDVTVQYETGNYRFEEQIIIVGLRNQPFSASGDSGSLILERSSQRAVGLLFAGSPSHTIANHIERVLQAMAVTLA